MTDPNGVLVERVGPRARPLVEWAAPRARLLAGAAGVGLVVGGLLTVGLFVLVHPQDLQRASSRAFAFGALALGFGVLGWSGSIISGRGFERFQTYLDTGTDWTERDSRRAMARISGFGAGVMIGVVPATIAL